MPDWVSCSFRLCYLRRFSAKVRGKFKRLFAGDFLHALCKRFILSGVSRWEGRWPDAVFRASRELSGFGIPVALQ
jgi:hypothetical protein